MLETPPILNYGERPPQQRNLNLPALTLIASVLAASPTAGFCAWTWIGHAHEDEGYLFVGQICGYSTLALTAASLFFTILVLIRTGGHAGAIYIALLVNLAVVGFYGYLMFFYG
jgi:hypothetical protein